MHSCIFEETPSFGQRYPLDIECYAPLGEDRNLCDQRLSEQSLELFQLAGGGADILWVPEAHSGGQEIPRGPGPREAAPRTQGLALQRRFVGSEDIDKPGVIMASGAPKGMHVVFSVRPVFSWGHLAITEHAFRHILNSLRVFTPFLRVVHTFGAKTNDKQRMRDIAYHRMQSLFAFELCYVIHYFELNGRQRGNPWSLRQTGVYHRYGLDQCSAWILLNLSSYINDRMATAIQWIGSADRLLQPSPLSVHIFIMSAAARNWSMYIEQLRRKVMKFEEKSYSSRVDTVYLDDYELLFVDVQALVSLSETLDTARAVLKGQTGVISRCGDLYLDLRRRPLKQDISDEAHALKLLKSDIQHYHEAVIAMAKTTSHITYLVSAILASRSSARGWGSISTIQTGVAELRLQSGQAAQNTARLLETAAKGQEDAIKIKIMAQIATMFLPASLIALDNVRRFWEQYTKYWHVPCDHYTASTGHFIVSDST